MDTNIASDSERFFNASTEKKISNPSLIPFQVADAKTNSDNRQIKELPITQQEKKNENTPPVSLELGKLSNLVTNDLLIPCPFCKAQGKENYFASDVDLAGHVAAHHSGSDQSYVR
jgi:hypothetical protein